MKITCHFLISTVGLLIKSIQPTNLCKLKMLVDYREPAFLGNCKRNVVCVCGFGLVFFFTS